MTHYHHDTAYDSQLAIVHGKRVTPSGQGIESLSHKHALIVFMSFLATNNNYRLQLTDELWMKPHFMIG